MVFRGWRETTSAATAAKTTGVATVIKASPASRSASFGPSEFSSWAPDATITRHVISPYRNQTNQTVARRLLPPLSRACSVDPSVTAQLYSTSVSQALRRALRGSLFEREAPGPEHAPFEKLSDVCLRPRNRRGFFEGVCAPSNAIAHLHDHPPPLHDSRIALF
jgi:hypothetical protein